jgi:hypothetical protein
LHASGFWTFLIRGRPIVGTQKDFDMSWTRSEQQPQSKGGKTVGTPLTVPTELLSASGAHVVIPLILIVGCVGLVAVVLSILAWGRRFTDQEIRLAAMIVVCMGAIIVTATLAMTGLWLKWLSETKLREIETRTRLFEAESREAMYRTAAHVYYRCISTPGYLGSLPDSERASIEAVESEFATDSSSAMTESHAR